MRSGSRSSCTWPSAVVGRFAHASMGGVAGPERLTQQAALRRVASLIARGAPPSELFAAVAYEVAQVTGIALVQIQRFEPDNTVTVAGAWGAAPHPFQPGTKWDLEGSQIAAPIKRTGNPVRIVDFGAGRGPIRQGVRKTGIRGGAGAPIIVDGELWGVMAAGPAKREPGPGGLEGQPPDRAGRPQDRGPRRRGPGDHRRRRAVGRHGCGACQGRAGARGAGG